jgi:hypothetical protein
LLICVLNSFCQSPDAYPAWIDSTIKPNLPPGARIADPEFIDLTLAIEPGRALAAIWPGLLGDLVPQRGSVCGRRRSTVLRGR